MMDEQTAMNRWEKARQEQQYHLLAKSTEAQEERIAEHYTAFANLALQLRQLIELRKHNGSQEVNDAIRHLTGIIREGHLMELGIELEWRDAEKPCVNPSKS